MSNDIDAQLLQSLHSLLRQKTDLQERLERGPRVIKAAENNEQAYSAKVGDIKATIKQTKLKADEKQLQLGERESHIEKLTKQRNESNSNRDYQLLTEQIAADEQANSVQQDEILEQLEKIEELETLLVEETKNLETLKGEVVKVREKVEGELDSIKKDLSAVEADIADAQKKLPGKVIVEFKRMASSMGEDALAKVEDKTCGHCFQIINTQMHSELMMSQAVFCGGCGSLLYLPTTQAASGEA